MSGEPVASSPWIQELDRQLLCGRSTIILHGNISEGYLWRGAFFDEVGDYGLERILGLHLQAAGYATVLHWDLADGLRGSAPGMRERFLALIQSEAAAPAASAPPPARQGRAPVRVEQPVPGHELRLPDQAVAAFRLALRYAGDGVAIVIHHADVLISDRERQPEIAERRLMVLLRRTMEEAAYIQSGGAEGRRNTLILACSRLARLPESLWGANPHLAAIEIAQPAAEEREAFLLRCFSTFHHAPSSPLAPVAELRERFTQATDGMGFMELDALRRTSLIEGLPIERPRDLVARHRCGKPDDPWERLDAAKLRQAPTVLSARVKGQDQAIRALEDMLISARVGINLGGQPGAGGRPKGAFLFVGPTGVGKTDLAKGLAEFIFGDETAMRRWDMSEFRQDHAAERLTGAPPGFVGFEGGGELTNWVRAHPFSILLFDEIEKAHARVLDRFLQILDDGRLSDGQGKTVSFHQSVIVFTSNIGASSLDIAAVSQGSLDHPAVEAHFRKAVRDHFVHELKRPELLNRISSGIVAFDCLRPHHIEAICSKFLGQLAVQAEQRLGVTLSFPGGTVIRSIHALMLDGDNLANGGRRVRTLVEDRILTPLCRWIFEHPGARRLMIDGEADGRIVIREEPSP